MAEEKFVKDNDYSLSVVNESKETFHNDSTGHDDGSVVSSLTKTFNFLSAQVTTVIRDRIYQSQYYTGGGAAAVTSQMFVQNFSDIDSKEEIKLMHAKLVELGGHPPELPFDLNKRQLGLNRPAA